MVRRAARLQAAEDGGPELVSGPAGARTRRRRPVRIRAIHPSIGGLVWGDTGLGVGGSPASRFDLYSFDFFFSSFFLPAHHWELGTANVQLFFYHDTWSRNGNRQDSVNGMDEHGRDGWEFGFVQRAAAGCRLHHRGFCISSRLFFGGRACEAGWLRSWSRLLACYRVLVLGWGLGRGLSVLVGRRVMRVAPFHRSGADKLLELVSRSSAF